MVNHGKIHALTLRQMDKTYQAPKGRMLSTLVIFVFILVFLYGLFLYFQRFNLNRDFSTIEEQTVSVQMEIDVLKNDQIQELVQAQELKERVEANAVTWSRVIRRVQDLTPITVFFSSYSLSDRGSVQLAGLGENYDSVADFLDALDKSSDLEDAFVQSVTLGTTGEGRDVVSFNVQVNADGQ
jgi:Tfp pilus assembly protein PilN